ncbi:MAG TPA: hypothetical protein VFZ21_05805 [Gemmatimonadaceae bacterium]|jgi:hypothetical protein|nr:hypothetical protein [Gemmatimonadaceae bacterium]
MNGFAAAAVPRTSRSLTAAMGAAIAAVALTAACSSGPQPETSGIPGFEPTIQTYQLTPDDRFFAIDSNNVVVISRDPSLLGGIFLLLDDAQLPYRRYLQTLPPRTTVALVVEPGDSVKMDSLVRATSAPVTIYERVEVPRDNSGNPLPIARFLVSSVRNKVARAWVLGTDSAAARALPDWVVAGVTQMITGFPTSSARNSQIVSQLQDLIPLDSLTRMRISESAVPSGVSSETAVGNQRRTDSRGRPIGTTPRRLPPEMLAALQAASIIEFMWAREGRGIVKQLVDRTRRGEPLSSVIAQAVSLPRDVAGLEAAWKASVTPPAKR